jgi:predicted flap endonuclease-1-like 5' DNA nuclease
VIVTRPADSLPLSNAHVADRLNEVADLLEAQRANPYRVRAYRNAAETLRGLDRPVHDILTAEGAEGLTDLPGIGESLARSVEQLAETGKLALLSRLRGDTAAEDVFTTVTGIGPELAARIHDVLGIETLAELEAAAYDGRLANVPGMGRKRIQGIREALAGRFRRRPRVPESRRARPVPTDLPPVKELLDVDREYREKAAKGRLLTIAPRRFNPTGAAWLPILHTHRGDRHYTALYSNTARAHELGTTRDWVVIYRDDRGGDGQWTVVTSRFGPLQGLRVIRGREHDCRAHYEASGGREPAESAPDPEVAARTDGVTA